MGTLRRPVGRGGANSSRIDFYMIEENSSNAMHRGLSNVLLCVRSDGVGSFCAIWKKQPYGLLT